MFSVWEPPNIKSTKAIWVHHGGRYISHLFIIINCTVINNCQQKFKKFCLLMAAKPEMRI